MFVPCPCLPVNERISPADYSVQNAHTPVDAEVYEDDFESLPNSEANDQSRRSSHLRSVKDRRVILRLTSRWKPSHRNV